MSERDLDLLYKRASGQDGARPSTAVRQALLEQARRLADQAKVEQSGAAETPPRPLERKRTRGTTPSALAHRVARWPRVRWQIAAPLAAAALAVILLQPQLRSSLPAPARLQESVPPAATAIKAPVAPAAPTAAPAVASNLAGSADLAASEARVSSARLQSPSVPAPLAPLRERAAVQNAATAAPAPSQSELLQQAAAGGDMERVRSLLQLNAVPLNGRDASGRTALMLAVLHDHEAVVRALLQRGADPNIADGAGRTPLAVARQQNQTPVVEALLQAGAH